MKLKRRQRVDGVRNEVRAPAKPWGKFFYLALIGCFGLWVFDLFFGSLFYFRADGLVVQDRVVLATQYDASVEQLVAMEGAQVLAGMQLATLRSQAVEENIAQLSAEVARMMEQASQLEVRRQVIEATQPLVARRAAIAQAAQREVETRGELFTQRDRMRRLHDELASLEERSMQQAELRMIADDLPKLREAISAAHGALRRLVDSYRSGALTTPVDGVVGYVHVSRGSVVSKATPMIEVYTGAPYVLAYVPEGALYELAPGDRVNVDVGFKSYAGTVRHIHPVSAALPEEYTNALRVPQRSPLAKIELDNGPERPSLFARTEVSASGWPPRWALRLLGLAHAQTPPQGQPPVLRRSPPRLQLTLQQRKPVTEPDVRAPRYTAQLFASSSRQAVERYAGTLDLEGLVIESALIAGQSRYVLTWGRFADRQTAEAEVERLPVDSWVRPLRSRR